MAARGSWIANLLAAQGQAGTKATAGLQQIANANPSNEMDAATRVR